MFGARYENEDEAGINALSANEVVAPIIAMAKQDLEEGRIPLNGKVTEKVICRDCGQQISEARVVLFGAEGSIPRRCLQCQEKKEEENSLKRREMMRTLRSW